MVRTADSGQTLRCMRTVYVKASANDLTLAKSSTSVQSWIIYYSVDTKRTIVVSDEKYAQKM